MIRGAELGIARVKAQVWRQNLSFIPSQDQVPVHSCTTPSPHHLLDQVPMHISQSPVDAVVPHGEFLVINSKLMQEGDLWYCNTPYGH
jgi:hypothetical protein